MLRSGSIEPVKARRKRGPGRTYTHLKIMGLRSKPGNYNYITLVCSSLDYKRLEFTLEGEDRVHLFRDRFKIGDSVNIISDVNNVIKRMSKALDIIV
jgi:hypothetical protein